jgi:hypothetical protein
MTGMYMLTETTPMPFPPGLIVGITAITTTAGIIHITTTTVGDTDIHTAMAGATHTEAGALGGIITALITHGDITIPGTIIIIIIMDTTAAIITTDRVQISHKITDRAGAQALAYVRRQVTTGAIHG